MLGNLNARDLRLDVGNINDHSSYRHDASHVLSARLSIYCKYVIIRHHASSTDGVETEHNLPLNWETGKFDGYEEMVLKPVYV